MWWAVIAAAAPMDDGGDRPLAAPEVPLERLYARLATQDGRVHGELRRRRDGEFSVWELESGTVVRVTREVEDVVVEEHLYDAGGYPTVSVRRTEDHLERAVLHAAVPTELSLVSWTRSAVPAAEMWLPQPPTDRPDGGVQVVLGAGHLAVWLEGDGDVFSDAFRDGLLAGCGCFVIDRVTTWIDGAPGIRYRLLVPGPTTSDALDLWAVPRKGGTWIATYRVGGATDPNEALTPGRVVPALVRWTEEPP